MTNPVASLAAKILVQGHAGDYVREISDAFGGRLSGSPSYREAAEWVAATFREFGLKNVRMESFVIPHGWERGVGKGRILAPLDRVLHVESLGWAPSTPPGGVRGRVAILQDHSAEYIESHRSEIQDRVVLLATKPAFGEHWTRFYLRLLSAYSLLKRNGAKAVLLPEIQFNQVHEADTASLDASIAPLPVAQIGLEDSKLIQRLGARGPVEVQYEYQNKVSGPVQVENVVAELPGDEMPDEWIMVGAHLDSWDYATGSQDNGSGVAMVLDAARALSALHSHSRRSIRFVLWGGEEEGLLGSTAWVHNHRAELSKIAVYLNTDNGAGHPRGWKVEGRKDLETAMKPISAMLSGLDGDGLSDEITYDTDHGPFLVEGIPVLDLWSDMSEYVKVHHKTGDTFDKIDNLFLNSATAIVSITAYALAEKPEPLVPRLDRKAVAELLSRANIDREFLKKYGWDF